VECDCSAEREGVVRDLLRAWDELADPLEHVRDKQPARELARKIDRIADRVGALRRKGKTLPG